MQTTVTKAWDIQTRPQLYARAAGALYLCVIVLGGLAEGLVMNALVSPGDTQATAAAILGQPSLWRLGLAANLLVPLIAVVQLWLEYLLFRPAGRQLAILFVLLNLASLSVEAVSKLFQLLVLPLAERGAADIELVRLALLGHATAFNIALIFFGAALLALGALIWRSTYVPRTIAVLVLVAGSSYLAASLSQLLLPAVAERLGTMIYAPMLIGEASLCLWLIVKGVNAPAWRRRALIAP